jgi:hypothetical protein
VNASAEVRTEAARRHAPKRAARGERGEVEAGVARICERWYRAMATGWPLNRRVAGDMVLSILADGKEQLMRVLLDGLGDDPE